MHDKSLKTNSRQRFSDRVSTLIELLESRDQPGETEMYVEHAIRSFRSDVEFLDLAALEEFADEVEDLSSDN
jgi:hypothetical protein